LKAWEKAHSLTLAIYKATALFPREELYGLTSQMRRSAYSVPTNIAEGCGRSGAADFARFLEMAASSASELEYQLILARDLEFVSEISDTGLTARTTELKRMLSALIVTVRSGRKTRHADS